MIKRRIDFEQCEFARHQRPWRRMYQIGNKIYKCNLIFRPDYISEALWITQGFTLRQRLRYFISILKHDVIMEYGPARTTEELNREADEINSQWNRIVKSGVIGMV